MERQNLKASGSTDTTLEFDLKAEGINIHDGRVLFVVQDDKFNYELPCEYVGGERWKVILPKMLGNKAEREYSIHVIAEDFFFAPVEGSIRFMSKDAVKAEIRDPNKPSLPDFFKAPKPSEMVHAEDEETAKPKDKKQKPVEQTAKAEETPSTSAVNVEDIVSKAKAEVDAKSKKGSVKTDDKPEEDDKKPVKEEFVEPSSFDAVKPMETPEERAAKQAKLKAILEQEKIQRAEEERQRREEEMAALKDRQKAIVEEHREKREKAQKMKSITKDFK